MIGLFKEDSGQYTLPMTVLAAINTGAVIYFAALLRFLPAKKESDHTQVPGEDVEDDIEAAMASGILRSDRSILSDDSEPR